MGVLLDATDLDSWADRRELQSRLPELLRRLVFASADSLEHISFRSDEGVQLGGWDGTVQSSSGATYVPSGYSGWEAGCDRDVKGKADDDYEKRSGDPIHLVPAQSTFVFVTPRRWRNKVKWTQARAKEGVWKKVVAYDADDLATWLAEAPAVHIWAAILFGKHPRDAEDLVSFSRAWLNVTRPPMTVDPLTAGRREQVEHLQRWARTSPSALAVQSDTEDEAIAFAWAALQEMPEPDRERHLARAIVVHDEQAWRGLAATKRPLLLIPRFADRSRVAAASSDGHHVAIPRARDEPSLRDAVTLARPTRDEARAALERMGVAPEKASSLAPTARASLGALRRALAQTPAGLVPGWASGAARADIIPAILAGHWDERSDADKRALAELAGRSYDEYATALARLAREPDPPVRQIGTTWLISAKDDAFALLADSLRDADLERFAGACMRALGEVDPKFELAPDQQWLAGLHGKVLQHSSLLREGLADTLALLGATSSIFPLSTTRSAQEWANVIVRKLLEPGTTTRQWASMASALTALSEGAPDVFLDRVDACLGEGSAIARDLFTDADPLFSSSPHHSLLWAIEVLAWSPEHLARAALALARLAEIDPGGKTGNRPIRSLTEIFLPWHPGTSASAERRIRVLDTLRKRSPVVSWALLCALLPRPYGTAFSTAKPRRRDWVPSASSNPQRSYFTTVQAVLDRVRSDVGGSGPRWKDLIEHLNHVPDEAFSATLDTLAAIDVAALTRDDRLVIWGSLRSFISRQREYASAEWSFPEDKLTRLDALYDFFEPEDALDKRAWLFNNRPEPPRCTLTEWRERHAFVEQLQVAAAEELAQTGAESVLRLAAQVQHPGLLGFALGKGSASAAFESVIFELAPAASNEALRSLVRGFLFGRAAGESSTWLASLRSSAWWTRWTADQKADYFAVLSFDAGTWSLVDSESAEVRESYWARINPGGLGELVAADRDQAASALMEHNRIIAAIEFLSVYSRGEQPPPDGNLIVDLLERFASPGTDANEATRGGVAYEVGKLLDAAAESPNVSVERIARLEWVFLRFLKHQRQPKVLHTALGQNASLFVDVLKLIYKARSEQTANAPEETRLRAGLARDLLHDWKLPPGMMPDGRIDATALRGWISEARRLAREVDRLEMCDQEIGRVLSYAPAGADGIWPHDTLREIIEDLASDEIETGIAIGIYNGRGVVSRAPLDGGNLEREIAERYHRFAVDLADAWPRSARLAKGIAAGYEGDARREDLRAELDKELW